MKDNMTSGATGAADSVSDAVNNTNNTNDVANATDGPFVRYVRKARPNMREASILQGEHWRIGHSNGIADPFRMVRFRRI